MHKDGHVGAALLAFSGVGLVLVESGGFHLAALGAAVVVGMAMLPDIDHQVPLLDHRGATHTLLFAIVGGIVTGFVAKIAGAAMGVTVVGSFVVYGYEIVTLQSYGVLLGTLTLLSHLAADAITPMGVPLLWPLSKERYSLDLVLAKNTLANYVLLVAGVLATLLWAWPGTTPSA